MPGGTEAPPAEPYDCLIVGPLPDARQARAWTERLAAAGLSAHLRRNPPPGFQQYLLYLGPIEQLEDLVTTVRSLDDYGVREYRVMNKGNLRNSISLGIYPDLRSAEAKLAEFMELGYRPMMMPHFEARQYWLDLSPGDKPPPAMDAELSSAGLRRGFCDSISAPAIHLPGADAPAGENRVTNPGS